MSMETLPRNVLWPNFAKRDGLLPVVVQCVQTHMVLMQAWVNEEAYAATLRTGKAHYFSTSRERLWMKGEESGAVQNVQDVLLDCDGDAVLYLVEQTGVGACHTQAVTCFFRSALRGILEDPAQLRLSPKDQLSERQASVSVSIPLS